MSVAHAEHKMVVGAIVPYFGGKRSLAADIATQLGEHAQYFEPFCGSMATLFAKKQSQKETVNDLHGDLINLARVLQHESAAPSLYERLGRVLVSEGLLDEAQDYLESNSVEPLMHFDPGNVHAITRAYWYFLASWVGRNGTCGTERQDYQIAVRWTKNGGSPTVRWRHAVESIPAWHERLRNVVILRRDAFTFLHKFEDVKGTAVYCDPPYHAASRSDGAVQNGRGGRYLHEFNHDAGLFAESREDDHARLRRILGEYRNARVVVSYYDCPQIRELYAGWTFIDRTRQKHLHTQGGRGHRPKEAPEVIIVNGPAY